MLKITSGSSTSRAYPILSNGAFAVDPIAPTGYTTTPGFSVLATNYAAYRVKKYRGSITFSGMTTTIPCETVVCHTNTLLGTAAGGTDGIDILQFKANRPKFNTSKVLNPGQSSQSQRAIHTFRHSISSITGESINQPGYKSLTNTVPSIPTYIVFGWMLQTAATNSIFVEVKLQMLVEYLDYIDTLVSVDQHTQISENQRLKNLGSPVINPCAGCKAVSLLEYLPCPDPQCMIVDVCSNCGYKRRCSQNCQSPSCPFKVDTVPLIPPDLVRVSSSKDVFDGFLNKTVGDLSNLTVSKKS